MGPILLPKDLRWSCHHHGVCCMGPDVELSEAERAMLARMSRENGLTEDFVDESSGSCKLAKRNGRCCFLTDENLCAIQVKADYSQKPLPCRQFPFIFTETPVGIQVGLSFACPSAVANHGVPLTEQKDLIEELIAQGAMIQKTPEALELSEDLPIEWADYRLVEAKLSDLMRLESLTVEEALIAGNAWLAMADLFVRQALQEGRATTGEALRFFAESMEADGYKRMIQIVRRPSGSKVLQRAFLGMIVAFRNTTSIRRGVLRVVLTILGSYIRNMLQIGKVRVAPIEQPIPYSDFQKVRFDSRMPELDAMLRRVMLHAIERKDLLRGGDLWRSQGLLLILYAMIRWYARALAAERKNGNPTLEEVVEAISLAEQYYGAHSRFFDLFQQYPVLNGIFFSVMRQKNFAHSLLL